MKNKLRFYLFLLGLISVKGFAAVPICDGQTAVGAFCKTYDVSSIRPTQYAVGFEMVEYKRDKIEHLEKSSKEALKTYLKDHPVPVVRGPDHNLYAIDHHHFTLALIEADIDRDEKRAYIELKADFSNLSSMDAFWKKMSAKKWVYAFDENNRRIAINQIEETIPKKMTQLKSDAYRSLAGILVESGYLKKVETPFSQFIVANYLRKVGVEVKDGKKNFTKALEEAIFKIRSRDAKEYVPGWVSRHEQCSTKANSLLESIHYPELDD